MLRVLHVDPQLDLFQFRPPVVLQRRVLRHDLDRRFAIRALRPLVVNGISKGADRQSCRNRPLPSAGRSSLVPVDTE